MHHSYVMHVTDGRHQFAHDAAGLCFTEMLFSADPLQQLTSAEQLQNQVRVQLQHTHTRERIYLHFSIFVTPIPSLYSLTDSENTVGVDIHIMFAIKQTFTSCVNQ